MAYGDPVDPTDPTAGYGGGGLLGNLSGNPLFNFGVGLLSKVGPSLTPQSGIGNIGGALQYASAAQQEATKNQLIRQKLAESARETAAQDAFIKQVEAGQVPGIPKENAGLFRAAPEAAIKAYVGSQFPDAVTQSTLALNNAQLLKLQREGAAETGDVIKQTVATIGPIDSIAKLSQRLENSPLFAPGGAVDQSGYASVVSGGLKAAKALGAPVSQTSIDDATDLATLDKATISMANNLQSISANLPRSGMAMQAVQTAAAAKMPWSAKRETLVPNLKAIIADIDEQRLGDKVPDYQNIKKLVGELEKQQAAYDTKRADADANRGAASTLPPGFAAAPPPVGLPPMLPGSPAASLGAQDGNLRTQPATQLTTTTPQPGVPQKTPPAVQMAIDPGDREGGPKRIWPRPADGEREVKKQFGPDAIGMRYIAINPQTGRPQVYTVTENNKGRLR